MFPLLDSAPVDTPPPSDMARVNPRLHSLVSFYSHGVMFIQLGFSFGDIMKKRSALRTTALGFAAALTINGPSFAQETAGLGEIAMFAAPFCPNGWVRADGRLLLIDEHTALFALFSTIYGGDGRTNFAVPNMAGVAGMGNGEGPYGSYRLIGQSVPGAVIETTKPGHGWGAAVPSLSVEYCVSLSGNFPNRY